MAPCDTAMRRVKFKGIHEPKGRVKGFRVEIRPPNSSTKIWVGTFDSRLKAMRAFDAAVYLTGKDPYYFVYPENYFSSHTPKPSKEEVQKQAKVFADRTDDLEANPASLLVDCSKVGEAPKVGSERINLNTTVVKKVAEKMDTPQQYPPEMLANLDEFLQKADYLEVPNLLPLANNDYSYLLESPSVEDSKVDLEECAFFRGTSNLEDIWKTLFDVLLPAPYDFPAIEDESFFLNFETPLKVSSKRKRDVSEGGGPVTNDRKSMGFLEAVPAEAAAPAANDDWFRTMISNEPNFF